MRTSLATIIVVMGLVQYAVLAADCNNPLFSIDNWPDSEDIENRPAYLAEPVELTDSIDLGICAGLLGDCTQTCCDSDTVVDIENVVDKYLAHLEKQAGKKVGPILDTIADFHPDTQEEVGYEYTVDGEEDGVVTGELPGATKGNKDQQSGQQGGKNDVPPEDEDGHPEDEDSDSDSKPDNGGKVDPKDRPKPNGKPSEEMSESDLETEYTEQQAGMGDRYRPKNRGKRRWRPGMINLSDDQKEEVRVLVDDMIAYLKTYSAEMAECLDAQLKQMAGLLCMGCNACYADYVTEDTDNETVEVTLSQDSCDAISTNCADYMASVEELRTKFKAFKDAIKAIVDSAVESGEIEDDQVHPEDLDDVVEDKPPKCTGDDCENYYCKEIFEANGGLAPSDEITDPVESSRRRLATYTVTYNYVEGEGYNPQEVNSEYTSQVDNFTSDDLNDEDEDSAYTLVLCVFGFLVSLL